MVVVPASVPLPGFVPIATVTFPVNPVAVLLLASRAVTCTAGVIIAPADVVLGYTENTSCVAVPAVMLSAVLVRSAEHTSVLESHVAIVWRVMLAHESSRRYAAVV